MDKDRKTKELKAISSLRFSFMFPCPIEYLNQNKVVFIGVGVGHVVGDLGLITSLSAAGYKVEKLG